MTITGDLKQWHKTTIDIIGPEAGEDAATFTDFRMDVTFTHESGQTLTVPGFFAADGNAAESGATSGNVWRAHFTAPLEGDWSYEVSLVTGENVAALRDSPGTAVDLGAQASGSFDIAPTDKSGLDSRAHGTLLDENFDGYLERKGSGEAWLKTGVDSPENFLAYEEFDNTFEVRGPASTPRYIEHIDSFVAGDPTWQSGKGDEILGAVNYLAGQGVNSVYIMPMTIGGDGLDTSPFVDQANLNKIPRAGDGIGTNKTMAETVAAIDGVDFDDFATYDTSKLDQWGIVFDHMQTKGINVHLVLQETENDQLFNDTGLGDTDASGTLSIERAVYLREMAARFGHNNYLTWNLGEENTQSGAEREAMFAEIAALDAYGHMTAIHTFPNSQETVYNPLLDNPDVTGASIQTSAFNQTADAIGEWVAASQAAGQRWVVMADETSDASTGVAADSVNPGHNDARSEGLWGALMSGGGGIEWYMGGNDQNLSDFATRQEIYRQSVVARELFEDFLPFTEMSNENTRLDLSDGREGYVFAKPDEVYLVYTEDGDQEVSLDLTGVSGSFVGYWFDPVDGGLFELGGVEAVDGGGVVSFGAAPEVVRDGRAEDTNLTGGREAIVEDAVLLVKRADVNLGITAQNVAQGRLANGDLGMGDAGLVAAINIGSDTAYTALDGTLFAADTVSTGRRFSANISIAGTDDDTLYQSETWTSAASLDYSFAVDDGDYQVELFFADIFSGTSQPGERVFDVVVEGTLAEDDLDLSGTVGFATALVSSSVVTVDDGQLDISLLDGIENPKLSALRITKAAEAINEAPTAIDDTFIFDADDVFVDPDTGLARIEFTSFDFLNNDIEDFVGTSPGEQEFFTANYSIEDEPAFGTFQIAGEGTFLTYFFDPATFPGTDSFTYRRQDSADFQLFSNEATVTIEIAGLPDTAEPEASFSLVDAVTDEVLFGLSGSTFIDADALAGRNFTSLVATARDDVESARLTLFDEPFGSNEIVSARTENVEPFALFGDTNGDFWEGGFLTPTGPGARITADLYTADSLGGDLVASAETSLFVQDDVFSDGFNLLPDLFAFDETVMGEDEIRNFDELDSLVFFGGTVTSTDGVLSLTSVVDEGTLIDFGDGNSLLLRNYEGLSADDIALSGNAASPSSALGGTAPASYGDQGWNEMAFMAGDAGTPFDIRGAADMFGHPFWQGYGLEVIMIA
ncbi:MAG: malectin domain-containing carbohydrate-binding protein [Pseudomonadota bacterium]